MARKPDRKNVRQKIEQLDEWIRSGSAGRDIEEAVRDGVERASRYVPPEALRRLGGLIDRARPLAARAAAVARDAARTATGGSTPFRSSTDRDDPSAQPASTASTTSTTSATSADHGRGTGVGGGKPAGTRKASTAGAAKQPRPARKTAAEGAARPGVKKPGVKTGTRTAPKRDQATKAGAATKTKAATKPATKAASRTARASTVKPARTKAAPKRGATKRTASPRQPAAPSRPASPNRRTATRG